MKLKLTLLWINIYKVKTWITYSEIDSMTSSIGWLGGFFTDGMRWKDYIDSVLPSARPYAEELRKAILKKEFKITGSQHQSDYEEGVPVFADNTIGTFSYRAWGDLMAAIWSEKENKDYNYMDFYM